MSKLVVSSADALLEYSRKSRADNPNETVEEVLAKHETIMQDFCYREFGFAVPQKNIYKEVVSGESIDERVEIKKVLAQCENPDIKGIVVVEPQRLSRGDLIDCGRLIDTLRYSNTMVVTPMMTYDLNNKMERRFFQDELMRGRDYLEYVKEILMRGRTAAAKKGLYCYTTAPYGYDRVTIGKDCTIIPNEKADTVKLIFKLYAEGVTPHKICDKLFELGIPSPTGMERWGIQTLNKMLKNEHYIGKITFQKRKEVTVVENGEKKVKRLWQKDGYICVEGKHQAIIDEETFQICQDRFATHPPMRADKQQRNMFAGLLFCAKCGKPIQYRKQYGRRKTAYYNCITVGCSPSVSVDVLDDAIVKTLLQIELPKLTALWRNNDGSAIELQRKMIKSLEKELNELREQEETQYELLETKKYTQDVFNRRNKVLREKMAECEKKIADAKRSLPETIDYKERVISLEEAIKSMTDSSIPVEEKNRLLRTVIGRIDCTSNITKKHGEYDFSLNLEMLI